MVTFNNDLPTRINESGMLLPEVKAKIVDLKTGRKVAPGERGELYIQTPAMMQGYFNNPEATSKFFVIDEDGERWAKTGDIARVKFQYEGQDVYDVSGRKSDSFVDEDGNIVYLFDIETKVEEVDSVREAEVVALTVDDKKVPIVHVVIDKENGANPLDVVRTIDTMLRENSDNPNAIPFAYKVRDGFEISPISGKRDYSILQYETDGYLMFDEDGSIIPTSIDSKESQVQNDLVHSKILVR